MKKYVPDGLKFLPKTKLLSEFLHHDHDHDHGQQFPLIIKDNSSWQQAGVKVVSNIDQVFKTIKDLKLENKKHKTVICEYIANIMLIHGLKFHIRSYFLVCKGNKLECHIHSDYRILTASKPYINSDWTNTAIHLSGGHNTTKRYFWPDSFVGTYDKSFLNNCQMEINACNNMICKLLSSVGLDKYPECKVGFEVYCADLLLTNNGKVYLLEINNKCSMEVVGESEGKKEYLDQFSEKFFKWILSKLL